ncbi:hypothetical protein EG68_07934 [Paragonimus skrjabini miyazakii]|uniref:Uncharacterized protein n=1 Tax=Paragonimus skrjabini miyazakii TaxID=59628 RepID=A0A8S9YUH6_9TREM|nr:hypothetical protein EG68_07934 [Paragonimus skrjabini miyazakii]
MFRAFSHKSQAISLLASSQQEKKAHFLLRSKLGGSSRFNWNYCLNRSAILRASLIETKNRDSTNYYKSFKPDTTFSVLCSVEQ